ncbi:hypothetical protein BH09DEP1_BH09DEP1_4570 [soil metagenome]
MKKVLSLALLFSTPAFAMEHPLNPPKAGSEQIPGAGLVPVIKVSEESIMQEVNDRQAYHSPRTETLLKALPAVDPLLERCNTALAHLNSLPEGNDSLDSDASQEAKKMQARIASNHATIREFELAQEAGYESDTEKELSKENRQLYRFNKYLNETTQTLTAAQPSLLAWFKNPEDDKAVEKLPVLSKKLEAQINRVEIWIKQIDSYNTTKTTSFSKLRNCIKAFDECLSTAMEGHQEEFKTRLVGNFSHPASVFLQNFEILQTLVDKS